MAEIKSTMEKVMERLAQMDSSATPAIDPEEKIKEGMRAAAGFLRNEPVDLAAIIASYSEADQKLIRKGMVRTLLRNIVLPRDKDQEGPADKAMHGLLQVGQGKQELLAICGDLKKILGQFLQHQDQVRKQLEEHFAAQMGQLEENLARQTGTKMKLQPAQHPKFKEELARLKDQVTSQYSKAIEQHKQMLEQSLV